MKKRLDELRKLGKAPVVDILKYDLTEDEALLVEQTAIDLLGLESLTNAVRGFGARDSSRGRWEVIASMLDAKPARIKHPSILININRLYRHDLSPQELYDATRSAWKVGGKRTRPEFAMAVYRGVIREVYRIAGWVPGGSTMKTGELGERSRPRPGRWEFVGRLAEPAVRRKYVGKSVVSEFKPGAQNPVKYVKCG